MVKDGNYYEKHKKSRIAEGEEGEEKRLIDLFRRK